MRLPRQLEDLARMLTYILCHRPDEWGLALAEDGSVSIKQLLQALSGEPGWGHVRAQRLEELAALMQPPRFAVSEGRIKALQPPPAALRRPLGEPPPALLYLAIPQRAHAAVWEEGLKPPAGGELLIAASPEQALKLGKRRGADILVTIQAQAAARKGFAFQGYGEVLFLLNAPLGREFLQLPSPAPSPKARPAPAAQPQPTPGSFLLDWPQALQDPAKPRDKRGKQAETPWKATRRAVRKPRRGSD
jgi:putative RNA 2'-phosphotransferase